MATDFNGSACGAGGEWCHSTNSTNPNNNASCQYHSAGLTDGAENYYGYIVDSSLAQAASNPISGSFTADNTPPVKSGFSPGDTATIITSTPKISFTLNEDGDCYAATVNENFIPMATDSDPSHHPANCKGDNTRAISCQMPDLGADGSKTIYFACKDTLTNADITSTTASVTYTQNTSQAHSKTFKGILKSFGQLFWK
jgi:hypothetical protein